MRDVKLLYYLDMTCSGDGSCIFYKKEPYYIFQEDFKNFLNDTLGISKEFYQFFGINVTDDQFEDLTEFAICDPVFEFYSYEFIYIDDNTIQIRFNFTINQSWLDTVDTIAPKDITMDKNDFMILINNTMPNNLIMSKLKCIKVNDLRYVDEIFD